VGANRKTIQTYTNPNYADKRWRKDRAKDKARQRRRRRFRGVLNLPNGRVE